MRPVNMQRLIGGLSLLKKNVRKIKELYVEKGFYMAEVDYELKRPGPSEVEVWFRVHEHAKVEVRREGRSAMYRLRRDRIDSVLGGWLRHLVPADPSKTWTSSGPRTAAGLTARTAPARPRRSKPRDKSVRSQGAPLP